MRFYDIKLSDASGKLVQEWTSYHNSTFDPYAQDIEIDAIVADHGAPLSQAQTHITIYGVPLKLLQQSQVFTGMFLSITGGMGGGMPLEDPTQRGPILAGQVFQSFGNWVGTEMTLEFVVNPSPNTLQHPGQWIITWRKGSQLKDALGTTFSNSYPAAWNISPVYDLGEWTQPHDSVGYYATLNQLAQVIEGVTRNQPNGPVRIAANGASVHVYDATWKPKPKVLRFVDLVGQPTWIDINEMQVKLVLRGDLNLGDQIELPANFIAGPGSVQSSPQSFPSQMKYAPTFTGAFTVRAIRHLAHFRASDAGEWCSIVNAVKVDAG